MFYLSASSLAGAQTHGQMHRDVPVLPKGSPATDSMLPPQEHKPDIRGRAGGRGKYKY